MAKPTVFFEMSRRVAAAALVGGAALVAASTVFSAEPYPKVIRQAVDSGVKVVKSFPAVSGLTGWVMLQDGRYSTVYTTADKKTLLAGVLIGESGENISAAYEEKYAPKPDLGALFQQLDKSSYVAEGTLSGPTSIVYVFVDANCPFCHYTWLALQPYEKVGLQVRWIPVATLGPTSMPKAIEVMAAADKVGAFRKMEENHGKPWTPSALASETAQPAVASAIRQNGELMQRFGIAGTPGVIWKDKQGKVQVKGGMPRLSELPAITGLPEQRNDDSSLNKFR
ncbi:thiol:disulfide interchange protein DsbG [Massilia sp. TWR1-2-2]|uniref:thiol:disulfide interchange protein DsbG n=1 Tax=Massilia sp. TWR1-2-2 TaxID=2804584 RepID=UPI003CE6A86B